MTNHGGALYLSYADRQGLRHRPLTSATSRHLYVGRGWRVLGKIPSRATLRAGLELGHFAGEPSTGRVLCSESADRNGSEYSTMAGALR